LIEDIEKVEIKRFHNLKTKFLPILKVYFTDKKELKIFGVCVGFKKATEEWKNNIERLVEKNKIVLLLFIFRKIL